MWSMENREQKWSMELENGYIECRMQSGELRQEIDCRVGNMEDRKESIKSRELSRVCGACL